MRERALRGLALLLALFAVQASAQELSLFAGGVDAVKSKERSYAWAFEFRQPLTTHFEATLGYLNEGHTPDHHRDGAHLQFWLTDTTAEGLILGMGLGTYRFFDTTRASGLDSIDLHGWALITSVTAAWRLSPGFTARAVVNYVSPANSIGMMSYLLGGGWRLTDASLFRTQPRKAGASLSWTTTGRELTALAGTAIVNTLKSEHGPGFGLEYRRGIGRAWDWTVSLLDEGNPGPIDRAGLASQVWLVTPVYHDRSEAGFGVGVYLFRDLRRPASKPGSGDRGFCPIGSGTFAWRLTRRTLLRLNWNRIVTDYNRDADVILVGVGMRLPIEP